MRLGALAGVAMLLVAACGSPHPPARTVQQPPTANMKPQTSIGKGEGALSLIDWPGYVQTQWQQPFEQQTGCKISYQDAGSSEEMVKLMADGGGGQWDMVSASGVAALQLIYDGSVKPMNTDLIPDWKSFQPQFQSPTFNTVNGVHYGISLQWGPNALLYNTKKFVNPPTGWAAIYDPQYTGLITIPDNAIQIADAALYLGAKNPSLHISDPYELTQPQFAAAVDLLKQQKPLVKLYWPDIMHFENAFTSGDVAIGAGWPAMTTDLRTAGAPVAETIPPEGATAWADTWMLATKAPHPNCAYLWTAWVSKAQVQAEQALSYGETPVNTKACAVMESLKPGSCGAYHADASGTYFDSLKFWKTPRITCSDGSDRCVPYDRWQAAWTVIKG